MDCDPTCHDLISKFYDTSTPIESLRKLTEIGKEGVNLLGISDAARLSALKHWRHNVLSATLKI